MATGKCLKCDKDIVKQTNFRLCDTCARQNETDDILFNHTADQRSVGNGNRWSRKKRTGGDNGLVDESIVYNTG